MSTINIDLTGETLYTGDGTLNSDRVVDCGTYTLKFTRNNGVTLQTSVAPTGGDASFNVIGNGSSGGSIIETIKNGSGNLIRQSYGDKTNIFFGTTSVGAAIGTAFLFEVNGTALSQRGIISQSSGLVAIQGEDNSNVGILGKSNSAIGIYGLTDTGIGGLFVTTASGFASQHVGKVLIEQTNTGVNSSVAIFEVNHTTKGSLPAPRMTTIQKTSITAIAGLMVYDTTLNKLQCYDGTIWNDLF